MFEFIAIFLFILSIIFLILYVRIHTKYHTLEINYERMKALFAQKELDYESRTHLLMQTKEELSESLNAVLNQALVKNTEHFITLTHQNLAQIQTSARDDMTSKKDELTKMTLPLQKSLEEMNLKLMQIEKDRTESTHSLKYHFEDLLKSQRELRTETAKLSRALRSPIVRGQWGEMQLRRVVELSGMIDHCDFMTQVSTDDGKLRPDMIIYLPGGKCVVVDAKTPLISYLDAVEAVEDTIRSTHFADHARHVKSHIRLLAQKSYFEQFDNTPEFVVLFLPSEAMFSAALEQDPSLIEFGVKEHIIVSTPTTLIALLRAVAYGWRQENLADNAKKIAAVAKELVKRLSDLTEHFRRLGKSLKHSVEAYNQSVGSYEQRLLSTARKFEQLDSGLSFESDLPILDVPIRTLKAHGHGADHNDSDSNLKSDC